MKQQDEFSKLSGGDAPDLTCRIPRLRKRDGRCYELAWNGCMQGEEWKLIHGEVNGPIGIARMGHAWLEFDGWAYDPVLDKVMRANVYAYIHKAMVHKKYSKVQAANKAIETGHHGPWGKLRVVAG
jgi:hypothetical protein